MLGLTVGGGTGITVRTIQAGWVQAGLKPRASMSSVVIRSYTRKMGLGFRV